MQNVAAVGANNVGNFFLGLYLQRQEGESIRIVIIITIDGS